MGYVYEYCNTCKERTEQKDTVGDEIFMHNCCLTCFGPPNLTIDQGYFAALVPNFHWISDACKEFYTYTQTIVGPILYKLSNAEYWKMDKTYCTYIFMEKPDEPGVCYNDPFIGVFSPPPNFYWIYEAINASDNFEAEIIVTEWMLGINIKEITNG